jgi:aminodeoxyfutalosine synthase
MGLKSNTTMLYGHVETPEERVDHMIQIRDLQDETGGILNFILLPYQPLNYVLKVQDVSCLMVPHAKAFWIYLTPPVAPMIL